jgi:hypothetical protein
MPFFGIEAHYYDNYRKKTTLLLKNRPEAEMWEDYA